MDKAINNIKLKLGNRFITPFFSDRTKQTSCVILYLRAFDNLYDVILIHFLFVARY